MLPLEDKYMEELDKIAQELQTSEEYNQYMEDEEEESYKAFQEAFEPKIAALHKKVAENDPLQLVAFEEVLLHPAFEGLFLPRILGFSVLRGELNASYKYKRPQMHFKDILVAICQSSNFEYIKKRIGQSVQIGFALSSDIWITDLINQFSNKRIRYYLQGQKVDKYRTDAERKRGHELYLRQFRNEVYQAGEFPATFAEMKVVFSELKSFLIHRIDKKLNNNNLLGQIRDFVNNDELKNTVEHVQFMTLIGLYFDLSKEDQANLASVFNKVRTQMPDFSEHFFQFIVTLNESSIAPDATADGRMNVIVDHKIKDEVTDYYNLADTIHSQGYINQSVMDEVKSFYDNHEGRSTVNEALRGLIYKYIHKVITNLDERDYHEFFEIAKVYTAYMNIFSNQHFNHHIKEISLVYVHKLLTKYVDKRGKDYQDIKKFVSVNFPELAFMKEKEISEMFKTRRKRAPKP